MFSSSSSASQRLAYSAPEQVPTAVPHRRADLVHHPHGLVGCLRQAAGHAAPLPATATVLVLAPLPFVRVCVCAARLHAVHRHHRRRLHLVLEHLPVGLVTQEATVSVSSDSESMNSKSLPSAR